MPHVMVGYAAELGTAEFMPDVSSAFELGTAVHAGGKTNFC